MSNQDLAYSPKDAHKVGLKITATIIDKRTKKVIKKTVFWSKSWVRGWFWLWAVMTDQTTKTPPANFFIDDTTSTIISGVVVFSMVQAANTLNGLQVGTSNQAVNADDNKLIARIADGILAGQLSYSPMTILDPTSVAGVLSQKSRRTFTNNSGASITIEEIGIHVSSNDISERVLIERSLFTQIITDTQALVLEYDFTETI